MKRVGGLLAFCLIMSVCGAPAVAGSDGVAGVSLDLVAPLDPRTIEYTCEGSIGSAIIQGRGWRIACFYSLSDDFSLGFDADTGEGYWRVRGPGFSAIPECTGEGVHCTYSESADSLIVVRQGSIRVHRDVSTLWWTGESGVRPAVTVWRDDVSQSMPRFSLSKGGAWLVFEDGHYGLGVLDVMSGGVRRLAEAVSVEDDRRVAVSPDGQWVATMTNRGVEVIEGQNCQRYQLVDGRPYYCHALVAEEPLWAGPQVRTALRFIEGDMLEYASRTSEHQVDYIRLRLHRPSPPPGAVIGYLALGDSYTSGEGEAEDDWYVPMTNTAGERCHLSARSYPFLVGTVWQRQTRSVACSGATISDIIPDDSTKYSGQKDRLTRLSREGSVDNLKSIALKEFIPGRVSQIEFVRRYRPQSVSIGVGGNDIGFISKLKSCIMPDVCAWATDSSLRAATAKEIGRLYLRYGAIIAVRLASPETSIVLVGYPQLVSPSTCETELGVLLSVEERRYIYEAIALVNRVMERAALVFGASYADVGAAYGRSRLCDRTLEPAMNTIRQGEEVVFLGIPILGSESFHPLPQGHRLLARSIEQLYPHPPLGALPCAACRLALFDVGSYWGTGTDVINAPSMVSAQFVEEGSYRSGDSVLLSTGVAAFDPYSRVGVEMYSDVKNLGTLEAGAEGALDGTVLLSDVGGGIHTLVLTGTLRGDPISYYQTIEVEGRGDTTDAATVPASDTLLPQNVFLETPSIRAPSVLGMWSPVTSISPDQPVGWWYASLVLAAIICLCAYNRRMNPRTIVKKLIPRQLFLRIEPAGHAVEAILANIRYGFPARKMRIIGVTGTNGKTTTSFMIQRLLHEAGINVALSTTVGYGVGADITPQIEHMTTVKASVLQRRLRDFASAGVEWVVIETSSHSLAQHRVWGIPYEIAVMTNVTHDHLDYHRTFARYRDAKRRLFQIANRHGMRFGVINADDPSAGRFASAIQNSVTYGIHSGDLRATNVRLGSDGSRFRATIKDEVYDMHVRIPGEFNVSNAMAALLVGRELGLSREQLESGIAALEGVEGRMSVIDEGQPFRVIVDFASSPDGFEKFFASVRPLVKGKLIAVFGSAGRRDEKKRATQGKIAGTAADIVVITEEDDRDDGEKILQRISDGAIAAGKIAGKTLYVEPSREKAIGLAFTLAKSKDDVVVLLGKGHEKTIERVDGVYPWNESDVARTALRELQTAKNTKS